MIDKVNTAAVEHPAWCFGPGHCDARIHPKFPTLGIIDPADTRDRGPRVLLSVVNPELAGEREDMSPVELRRCSEVTMLEPEEARMLARFLIEAADERNCVART